MKKLIVSGKSIAVNSFVGNEVEGESLTFHDRSGDGRHKANIHENTSGPGDS